ncbi:MAG: hypothetical protein JWP35_1580 [Caulobacter sp.]|nr:hypothetical protein [Caulobacter sp.]
MRSAVLGLTALAGALAGSAFCGPALAQEAPPPTPAAEAPAPSTPPPESKLDSSTAQVPTEPAPPQPKPPAQTPGLDPGIPLTKLETADLSLLYFDPTETYLTPYIARSFENAMVFQKRVFGWEPWDKTTVLLKDFGDYGNAAARSSPNNALLIDIAPLSLTFETFSAGERFFTLMNHEQTHVATMDMWNERDAFWRHAFGGKPMALQDHPETILYNYLTTPRVNVPRWYLEGSAVFMETWMAGGFGRAQGAYDEMVFRAKVQDGAKLYSPLGLESEGTQIDFQVGVNEYLYGTRFFSYLAYHYSPEMVVEWLKRGPDSKANYADQFAAVFGKPLDEAWQDWIVFEHSFQKENLAALSKYPTTPVEKLTPQALGSVSRTFYDPKTNSLIGAFRYPGVIGHVGVLSLETGQIRKLVDIKGAMLYRVTSLAYDPASNTAWYTADNYAYRDLMQVDVASGKQKMLIKDGRIGDIVFDPQDKSIWGLRHLNGVVTLVRLPAPYTSWNQIHTFDYGTILFDLDISPDGKQLSTSYGEINGDQSVVVYNIDDLRAGEVQPVSQFKLGASAPESFVFSPDGKYLYGSAYYTGVSNIYRYELATQKVEAVSNATTGFFRPIPQANGKLIAYQFTGQGFAPVRFDPKPLDDLGAIKFLGAEIVAKHPVVKTWAVGSPASVPLDSMITNRGPYVPRKEMKLGSAYPVIEGYKGTATVGWHAIFEDPMQFSQLTATLTYSPYGHLPYNERWHADIRYHALSWKVRYWHNDADFYDLFGPTERSRKGDALIVGYHKSFIYDPPRQLDFFADVAAYSGLDTLPGAQNVAATSASLQSVDMGVKYTNFTKSLGGVDHEKGLGWAVTFQDDMSSAQAFPKVWGNVDFGFPLALHNSSVWLYTAAGAADGDRTNPLSALYLGSFGNNYVDDGEVKRYREFDSFPGFEINGIAARRFAKTTLEWNLPPLRFSNIGNAGLFLYSARPAVFAGAMVVEQPFGPNRNLQTAGFQVDWNFTFAFRLPMTFSVGYAQGFEDGRTSHSETMISLKIL